jgi:WD40 repeat protein
VAGGRDGGLVCFSRGGKEPVWRAADAHAGPVDCVAFSPEGRQVASASLRAGSVCLWNAATGSEVWRAPVSSSSVAFAGSGVLVTGPALLSATDGREAAELAGEGPAAASPDGRFAFTAAPGNEGSLWYLPALLGR